MASDAGGKPQKEINRLKMQVKRLQKEKDKAFPDLGRATYQAFLEGRLTDPMLVENSERLKGFDSEMESANAEIARLQSVVQQMKAGVAAPGPVLACGSCGAPLTTGLRFCGNCGTPVAMQAPPAPAGAVCPNCGSPVAAGVRFCGECDQAMPAGAVQQAQTAPASPAPAPPPPAPATSPPPPPPSSAPSPQAAPPEGQPQDETKAKCPSCGIVAEDPGAAFCGECGAKL
jgi:hypothetical protein